MEHQSVRRKLLQDIGQCVPVRNLNWHPSTINYALTNQHLIISLLPSCPWSITFLKYLISLAESNCTDVKDEIYEKLTSLFVVPPCTTITKKYYINDKVVSIVEDVADISHGTTGLKTWQASLMVLEFILANPSLIIGQRVLELGAGCGLLGICCSKLGASKVTMTDFEARVLERLDTNVALNGAECEVHKLDWHEPRRLECDLVVCADIVYDPSLIPPLCTAIRELLANAKRCVMGHTNRRDETLVYFREQLAKCGLTCISLDVPPEGMFYMSEGREMVHIFEIKLG
jgi:predicted nicotinamide N-methyase